MREPLTRSSMSPHASSSSSRLSVSFANERYKRNPSQVSSDPQRSGVNCGAVRNGLVRDKYESRNSTQNMREPHRPTSSEWVSEGGWNPIVKGSYSAARWEHLSEQLPANSNPKYA